MAKTDKKNWLQNLRRVLVKNIFDLDREDCWVEKGQKKEVSESIFDPSPKRFPIKKKPTLFATTVDDFLDTIFDVNKSFFVHLSDIAAVGLKHG